MKPWPSKISVRAFQQNWALRDVSLLAEPGQTIAIPRCNGAGKSNACFTVDRWMVAGIRRPDQRSTIACQTTRPRAGRLVMLLDEPRAQKARSRQPDRRMSLFRLTKSIAWETKTSHRHWFRTDSTWSAFTIAPPHTVSIRPTLAKSRCGFVSWNSTSATFFGYWMKRFSCGRRAAGFCKFLDKNETARGRRVASCCSAANGRSHARGRTISNG